MSEDEQENFMNDSDLLHFYKLSKRAFGDKFKETGRYSVLVAQNKLEDAVDQGRMSAGQACLSLQDPETFTKMLLKEDKKYQDNQIQELHGRMDILERNTDWKAAAIVSLGTGLVLGLVFAFASPFISAWLQPTADEMFKRKPPQSPIEEPAPTDQYIAVLAEKQSNIYQAQPKRGPRKLKPIYSRICAK